jgi:hypothetical protein
MLVITRGQPPKNTWISQGETGRLSHPGVHAGAVALRVFSCETQRSGANKKGQISGGIANKNIPKNDEKPKNTKTLSIT